MVVAWVSNNLLAVATVALAIVAVVTARWTISHDTRERRRERRYARILQAQAALRLSATLAGQFDDSRSWRALALPILLSVYVGIGSLTRQLEVGRVGELLVAIATSRYIGTESVQDIKAYAFLRSAYDVAGLLSQLGRKMPDVVARLEQSIEELQKAPRRLPGHRSVALEHYLAAVRSAHIELDRIINEERLEARSKKRTIWKLGGGLRANRDASRRRPPVA